MEHLKQLYRGEFRVAFDAALETLTPRERNLLRHQFVDHLNLDQIGALYQVHRATAWRWLTRAHKWVFDHTREAMMQQL